MTIKLIFSALAVAASFSVSVQANQWADEPSSDTNMSNSAVMQNNTIDNDTVNCWGWDGSKGGNDIKKMSRYDCRGMHGVVENHALRISNNSATKK